MKCLAMSRLGQQVTVLTESDPDFITGRKGLSVIRLLISLFDMPACMQGSGQTDRLRRINSLREQKQHIKAIDLTSQPSNSRCNIHSMPAFDGCC